MTLKTFVYCIYAICSDWDVFSFQTGLEDKVFCLFLRQIFQDNNVRMNNFLFCPYEYRYIVKSTLIQNTNSVTFVLNFFALDMSRKTMVRKFWKISSFWRISRFSLSFSVFSETVFNWYVCNKGHPGPSIQIARKNSVFFFEKNRYSALMIKLLTNWEGKISDLFIWKCAPGIKGQTIMGQSSPDWPKITWAQFKALLRWPQ